MVSQSGMSQVKSGVVKAGRDVLGTSYTHVSALAPREKDNPPSTTLHMMTWIWIDISIISDK